MDQTATNQKNRILLKIRQASDFPAMAETVTVVNKFKASEDTSVSELASILLRDYALTTKILRVVNSVHYSQSGQVTTISRAIFIMGIERIKQIALTLMLFEHMQKHNAHAEMTDAVIQAFCSGVLAQKIVQDLNYVEEEEAFICGLLHPLGKIIVAHTMPDKIAEIRHISAEQGISEEQASVSVLGLSFEEIGTTIATEWNYPQKLVQSMHHTAGADVPAEPQQVHKLSMIASLSNEMSNVLATDAEKTEKEGKIKSLMEAYKDRIPTRSKNINELIGTSVQDFNKLASELDLNVGNSSFSKQLNNWVEDAGPSVSDKEVLSFRTESLKTVDAFFEIEEENPDTIFSKGIQDLNNSILGPHALNDVIHIALETIFRGMKQAQVIRVLFFVRNIRRPQMEIRFGFGGTVSDAKKWFIIQVGQEDDIFNMAVAKDQDLIIKDTASPEIKKFIPPVYKNNVPHPGYMILFPVTVSKKNIGLICIEGDQKGFSTITRASLNYLKILRDQIVMATTQSLRTPDRQPSDR